MLHDYQSVDALITEVKGTAGFLSSLFSRKSSLVLLFIVFGVIVSKLLFS
jgi:hypothetical protein